MYKLLVMCGIMYISTTNAVTQLAYITGKLRGCVYVNREPTCHINYPVPEYFARHYLASIKLIKAVLPNNRTTSKRCKETFRKLLCSQRFPRCNKSRNILNFGNASLLCAQLSKICSNKFLVEFVGGKICQTAQSGSFRYNKCVNMKRSEIGNCTAKHKLVPAWIADRHRRMNSVKSKTLSARVIKCTKRVPQSECKIPFCSSDKKYILSTYTRQNCKAMIKCLSRRSQFQPKYSICRRYPNENRARKVYFP